MSQGQHFEKGVIGVELEYQEITEHQGPVPLSYEGTEAQRHKDLIHITKLILGKD